MTKARIKPTIARHAVSIIPISVYPRVNPDQQNAAEATRSNPKRAVILSDFRKIGKLVVIDVLGIALVDLLFNKLVYNTITLPAARASHADASPLRAVSYTHLSNNIYHIIHMNIMMEQQLKYWTM